MRRTGIIISAATLFLAAAVGPSSAQIPPPCSSATPPLVVSHCANIIRDANGVLQQQDAIINPQGIISPGTSSIPTNVVTTNGSVTITTGLTYQQILSTPANDLSLGSLFFQNNQISGTDTCWIIIDVTVGNQIVAGTTTTSTLVTVGGNMVTAGSVSIILVPGQLFLRTYPILPGDAVFATCATTGDTLFVATQ
jgi:hypothetical protein